MTDNKYNGWTNYATWRVNLEMFDGGDWAGYTAQSLQAEAEYIIEESSEKGLARDYAMAFLDEVNWHEIAAAYNEEAA